MVTDNIHNELVLTSPILIETHTIILYLFVNLRQDWIITASVYLGLQKNLVCNGFNTCFLELFNGFLWLILINAMN